MTGWWWSHGAPAWPRSGTGCGWRWPPGGLRPSLAGPVRPRPPPAPRPQPPPAPRPRPHAPGDEHLDLAGAAPDRRSRLAGSAPDRGAAAGAGRGAPVHGDDRPHTRPARQPGDLWLEDRILGG